MTYDPNARSRLKKFTDRVADHRVHQLPAVITAINPDLTVNVKISNSEEVVKDVSINNRGRGSPSDGIRVGTPITLEFRGDRPGYYEVLLRQPLIPARPAGGMHLVQPGSTGGTSGGPSAGSQRPPITVNPGFTNGIITGLVLRAGILEHMGVNVTTGLAQFGNTQVSFNVGTLDQTDKSVLMRVDWGVEFDVVHKWLSAPAPTAGKNRFDIVSLAGSPGYTVTYTQGVDASDAFPALPAVPSGHVYVGSIFVHADATKITQADLNVLHPTSPGTTETSGPVPGTGIGTEGGSGGPDFTISTTDFPLGIIPVSSTEQSITLIAVLRNRLTAQTVANHPLEIQHMGSGGDIQVTFPNGAVAWTDPQGRGQFVIRRRSASANLTNQTVVKIKDNFYLGVETTVTIP